jgi:hypothetical protein
MTNKKNQFLAFAAALAATNAFSDMPQLLDYAPVTLPQNKKKTGALKAKRKSKRKKP